MYVCMYVCMYICICTYTHNRDRWCCFHIQYVHTYMHTCIHIGLTIGTAGVAATFNLIVRDQFGNVQDTPSSLAFARVDSDSSCGLAGSGRALAGNCTATIAVIPNKIQQGGLNRFTVSK